MLIRLENNYATPTHRGEAGQIIDLPTDEAARLLEKKLATAVQPGELRRAPVANRFFGLSDPIGDPDDDFDSPQTCGEKVQAAAFAARRRRS